MTEFTTAEVRDLLAGYDEKGAAMPLSSLLLAYTGNLPTENDEAFLHAVNAIRRDLSYDPNSYISTMDYTPMDRLASVVRPLWTDELTEKLAEICADVMDDEYRAEDFFRWNRSETVKRIARAAALTEVQLPVGNTHEDMTFFCPYAFTRLYMAGKTGQASGILLRRVNCRPWGIKPYGATPDSPCCAHK